MEVESDDVVQQFAVDDVHRCVESGQRLVQAVVRTIGHHDRSNTMPRRDEPLDGDGPLGHEELVALDPPPCADVGELAARYGERFEPPKMLRDMAAEGRSFYS